MNPIKLFLFCVYHGCIAYLTKRIFKTHFNQDSRLTCQNLNSPCGTIHRNYYNGTAEKLPLKKIFLQKTHTISLPFQQGCESFKIYLSGFPGPNSVSRAGGSTSAGLARPLCRMHTVISHGKQHCSTCPGWKTRTLIVQLYCLTFDCDPDGGSIL